MRQGRSTISDWKGASTDSVVQSRPSSRSAPRTTRPARLASKRLADIVISVVLLVLLSPVMLLLAIAILLESRGSVVYRCERSGYHGRTFAMFKFRKMHHDALGPALTLADDDRFTRMGRFLSRTKLDELPQLWNVVQGDMSLVGPRPEDPAFVAAYPKLYAEILSVRPGLTGLSQLAFLRESALLGATDTERRYVEWLLPSKVAIDRLYIARRSMVMDLRVLVWTAAAVFFGKEIAVNRGTGALTIRRRLDLEPKT